MQGDPTSTPRWIERVRLIVLRVAAVAAGLGLWFWSQSLIGARGFPEGCVWDGLHQLTAGANAWLVAVPSRGDALLICSSLVIDVLGIFLLAASVFGRTIRPFLGLVGHLRAPSGLAGAHGPAAARREDLAIPGSAFPAGDLRCRERPVLLGAHVDRGVGRPRDRPPPVPRGRAARGARRGFRGDDRDRPTSPLHDGRLHRGHRGAPGRVVRRQVVATDRSMACPFDFVNE